MSDKKGAALEAAHRAIEKMLEGIPAYKREMVMKCHFLQCPDERKARMKAIIALSVELELIRSQEIFATLFGETAIESIVEGDWKRASDCVGWLSFSDESEELRARYAPLWEKFREILQTACVEARHREDLAMRHVLGQLENN